MKRRAAGPLVAAAALFVSSVAAAQQPAAAGGQSADLAKQLSNPIADLVSVPFQFNWEQNVGPREQTRFLLNVQPVMPFSLNPDWNLVARVIAPFMSQPVLVEGGAPAFGVGDITASFFFAPARAVAPMFGVGPVIMLPSTAEPSLGTGKWSVGPTAVVLRQQGPWTYGALWNQVWSFSGDDSRADVNQMFLQPFLAYQATRTITVTMQSESTANWEAEDEQWTVPINLIVSKLSSFGIFPASYQFGLGGFVAHPEVGPSWKVRAAIVILLPRTRK